MTCTNGISLFIVYHFLLRYWIKNPTATIAKSRMITNSPITVKVIPTNNCELLCTILIESDVVGPGVSVSVVNFYGML